MSDSKPAAGGGGSSDFANKLLLGILAIGMFFAFITYLSTPKYVIQGGSIPSVQSPSSLPAVAQTRGGVTNHGHNQLCAGRPKFTSFTCVSPSTGRQTTCFCD